MPIYLLKCPKCGKEKEVLKSFKEINDPVKCECGEEMKIKIQNTTFKMR